MCITGSDDDADDGAGEGELAEGVATGAETCRVCIAGSDEDGAAGGAAAGSGASGALGLVPGEDSEVAAGLACAAPDAAGKGGAGAAGAGALAFAVAALFPAFCRASIKSSLAPSSWNFLARSGLIWKSTPRCCTVAMILLDELASRSKVTSSFDNGWSARAAAEPNQPAIVRRANPTVTFVARRLPNFIAEYL